MLSAILCKIGQQAKNNVYGCQTVHRDWKYLH
jgi:hypothetical protein